MKGYIPETPTATARRDQSRTKVDTPMGLPEIVASDPFLRTQCLQPICPVATKRIV